MPDHAESLRLVTISEFEKSAKQKLSKEAWSYYRTGADDEFTLHRNSNIYNRLFIRPRVLRDVSHIDTTVTIFGKHYNFPIAIAPSAYQRLVSDDGEKDMYRASRAVGTNMTLSTNSTTSLEDVVASAPAPSGDQPHLWLQLYVMHDKSIAQGLLDRAKAAGAEAVVVTVDTPVIGNRIHERREPLTLPPHMSRANLPKMKVAAKSRLILNARTAAEAKSLRQESLATLNDDSMTWQTAIPWLRKATDLKILLKGIMTAEDALLAVEAGVDGIVVSNHGARQLDGMPSTLEALSEVAAAVAGRIPVVFDGGIKRGADVFKALALGADLCLIGRSALWGLAHDGQRGVEDVLHILERELFRTMALAGAASIKDIKREMLGVERQNGFGVVKL
ncbi:Hydroxyacid oxidase 1 [Cyphellophora attinorum]|uniref:Hydroxyacid oxidase 1 n=1 Tax=Cyphellophora attinorum TaxID=1664694 RepID=A0A0N1H546_9EURO|nr:Hydroxyacid oxidase 1 [Phialophora attinorum]KPI36747.1 Hydroxyacid oxidase 1 [Phialophora attinorum]